FFVGLTDRFREKFEHSDQSAAYRHRKGASGMQPVFFCCFKSRKIDVFHNVRNPYRRIALPDSTCEPFTEFQTTLFCQLFEAWTWWRGVKTFAEEPIGFIIHHPKRSGFPTQLFASSLERGLNRDAVIYLTR